MKVGDYTVGFIGFDIQRQDDGSIELNHKGLIDRIISAVGFKNVSPKNTRAESGDTPADEWGTLPQENWSYYLMIQMLKYLAGYYQTDISMDVYKCAL